MFRKKDADGIPYDVYVKPKPCRCYALLQSDDSAAAGQQKSTAARDELTSTQTAAVEQAILEHQARRRLSAGEQAMAARLGVSPCGFEGLKRAHAKSTGADGNVLAQEGVTEAEAAVARALGVDLASYSKEKSRLRAQLGLDK